MAGPYDSRPPEAPSRLGRYVVVRRLGAGGMAEVFLARSRGAEGTDKLLVVKRILPAFAINARFRSMFVDEAKVALRLNHPNIVQVYGFESDGPILLLVMEYVDGPDLAALAQIVHARGEMFSPGLAAWIVREVARGLHYAHERRDEDGSPLEIVHRDVSPGNILLSHDGIVKLGDFGIAKARLVSGEEEGSIKGKFAYMSPEQARTESVDRRADLYSLGVVLGELLAGKPLVDKANAGAELLPRLRQGETPDIDRAAPDAPEALRAIVAKLLSPDRTNRFATARDVALALTRYLRGLDEEWDAATLEQYVTRRVPRPASINPAPAADLDEVPHDPEAPTAVRGRVVRNDRPHSSRPPTAALDTSGLMRERLHVAVLALRIVAPVTSAETVDTRPLSDLIESLAFKAGAALERNDEGRFMFIVGLINPNVEHALRAARLALDIADAAQALAADQGSEVAPSVAMGIARGVAAAARGNSGSLLGYEVVDEAVSFAVSLSDNARSGEILATPGIYRLVRRAFVLSEQARATGASRSYRLERLKTRNERELELGATHGTLVGRQAELTQLRDAIARVAQSQRAETMLVVGELGVGKSALLGTFAAEYESEGAVVRVSVSFGGAEGSYRAIGQLFCELLGVSEDQSGNPKVLDEATERAIQIASIHSQAGQRAARRAMRVAFGLATDEAGNEGGTVREIVLVARRLLVARALMGPIVLIVDGLELVDRHSRMVIQQLVERPPAAPILILLGARDTDEFARAAHNVTTILLGPLGEEARGKLIARRLGVDLVGAELLREVSAAAGGNPLMVLEVTEALSDRGRVDVRADEAGSRVLLSAAREGELPLPATLEEVLAARIDALPPEARSLARWCALMDSELPIELVDAFAGEDGPRALGRLIADGILVRVPGRNIATFAHAALAKVARASVDPTQLAGMHARIANVLERRPEARGAGAGIVARHREAAGALRPAARAWLEAANALRIASQNTEALDAYVRVLDLTQEAVDPEGYALRFAAHTGREEIARGAGKVRARRGEIVAMRAVAVDAKDPRLIARALARQARYKLETGLGSGVERDVAAAARAARRAGELRAEAEAKRVLAVYLGQQGRYAEGIHAADEALAALETRSATMPPPGGSAEDGVRSARTVRIEALIAKGALLRQTGEIDAAIEVYAEAYALLSRFGPRRLLAHVLNNLGTACFSRGDVNDALRLYLAAIALHRENGQRDRLGMVLSNAGQTYAALGQIDRAFAFLRKAIQVYDAVGTRSTGCADAHVALAELHTGRGEFELALAEIERARVASEGTGSKYDRVRVKLGEALVALARKEFRAARASAEEAERVATEAGIVVQALHARALAAEAAASAGDRAAARRFVDTVLADPQLEKPQRLERAEMLLGACERTLRALGDDIRADRVRDLQRRRMPTHDRAGAGRPIEAPT